MHGVKNIQAAAYNGTRTVVRELYKQRTACTNNLFKAHCYVSLSSSFQGYYAGFLNKTKILKFFQCVIVNRWDGLGYEVCYHHKFQVCLQLLYVSQLSFVP